jgi:glycosyltransferase involved in cell wall biosynthesis
MAQMRLWRHWRDAFDLFVANSHVVERHLLAEGIGPVEVVWNGVPICPPRPPLASPPTVAFAGRLVREKGLDILLHAMTQVCRAVPDARLLVAGDGPERQHLETLAARLGLTGRVSFLGHVPHPALEKVLAAAWVQAVPSRWVEPFGIVALEAMMRGTAVVATQEGGLAEIVRPAENGLLVPAGDVGRLAEALIALLQDRERAEAAGRNGREVALSQFTEEHHVERFLSLYEALPQRRTATYAH